MKTRIKDNLWKLDINTRFGRYRTKKGNEFRGSAADADMEILRIKALLKKKTKRNILLDKSACRKVGDCLLVYKRHHPELKEKHREHIWNNLWDNLGNVFLPNTWLSLKRHVEWMKTKNSRRDKPYSIASINREIDMLKAAIHLCYIEHNEHGERLIPENYLEGFPKEKENNIRYKILSDDEIKTLHSNLPEYMKPLFYFSCRVPARISELINLRKHQVQLFNKMIILEDGTTKNGFGRWLPIFPECFEYFETILKQPGEWVFSNAKGEKIGDIHKSWNTACKKSGIDPREYNWHKTRQQSAMEMLKDGFSEMETMTIGGWRSREAFRRYVRMDEEMLKIKLGLTTRTISEWKELCAPKANKEKEKEKLA